MSRSAKQILTSILGLLHVGWVYARRGGELDALLGGAAHAFADAEASAEDLMDQTDPRGARELLADFERVLGPDHCGRDLAALTVHERQAMAHQRWTARGGQDIPYLLETAGRLDEAVEIIEFWPSRCGAMQAGDQLVTDGEQFLFAVRAEADGETILFRCGASTAGERLGSFSLSGADCELRRIKPAHTEIAFEYVDFMLMDGEPLLMDVDRLCLGA